jgi:HK97 family phage portal protein
MSWFQKIADSASSLVWTGGVKAQGVNTITTSRELEEVLLQGAPSSAGIPVNAQVAMMVAAVSAATTVLAETVAQLPLPIYRKMANGDRERAESNPLWKLLHDRPNHYQDSFQFREMLMFHLLLWGNAYAAVTRSASNGRILELLPIHPDRVKPEIDDSFRVTYRVYDANGSEQVLTQRDMLHIRDRCFNGITGQSRLKSGKDSIGLARVAEQWGARLFQNSARPAGVLTTEQSRTPEQMKALALSWKSAHGGENALGTAVLDGGWKWEPIVMKNTDAQFLETRRFQIGEIARVYRVPLHMLSDLERATFSNIEHQSLEFVTSSLMPWLRRWEMAINTQLLEPDGQFYAEFTVEGLLRGDIKTRFESYERALRNGWLNRNEVRRMEGRNSIPGGEEYTLAENIYGDGEANEPAETAGD